MIEEDEEESVAEELDSDYPSQQREEQKEDF